MLETDRLSMRWLTERDLDELAALRADSDIMRYIGEQTREKVSQRLQVYIASYEKFGFGSCGVSLKGQRRLIGWCGLGALEDTGEIEVGYGFEKPYWGQGLATEAAGAWLRYGFEHAGLKRIVAIAMPENIGSWRVMEKLGMKYERDARHYGVDVVYYAIERDDFYPDERSVYVVHE
jgi:ribosomal-protein-alanine N-acetyltransferase